MPGLLNFFTIDSIFSNSVCVFQGVKESTDTYKRLSYFTIINNRLALESLELQKYWIHLNEKIHSSDSTLVKVLQPGWFHLRVQSQSFLINVQISSLYTVLCIDTLTPHLAFNARKISFVISSTVWSTEILTAEYKSQFFGSSRVSSCESSKFVGIKCSWRFSILSFIRSLEPCSRTTRQ